MLRFWLDGTSPCRHYVVFSSSSFYVSLISCFGLWALGSCLRPLLFARLESTIHGQQENKHAPMVCSVLRRGHSNQKYVRILRRLCRETRAIGVRHNDLHEGKLISEDIHGQPLMLLLWD